MANSYYLYSTKSFVWLDEIGIDRRNCLRKYGYAFKGGRAVKHTFLSRGKRINCILASFTTLFEVTCYHNYRHSVDHLHIQAHAQHYNCLTQHAFEIILNDTIHFTDLLN